MTPEGIAILDKPAGMTSHDVVGQVRRILHTRKVGHAGTLDPMATGILVIGVGRATRLLGYLSGQDKQYLATIRLGQATTTDDAQGEVAWGAAASRLRESDIHQVLAGFVGDIQQRPSTVSAIKIEGERAYKLARRGAQVDLPARPVRISAIEILSLQSIGDFVDIEVLVDCSAGTYIRAIARDLGQTLEVGGHLTALRRTRSGAFSDGQSLADFAQSPHLLSMGQALTRSIPCLTLPADAAGRARHGVRVTVEYPDVETVGVLDENGEAVSVCRVDNGLLISKVVFQ